VLFGGSTFLGLPLPLKNIFLKKYGSKDDSWCLISQVSCLDLLWNVSGNAVLQDWPLLRGIDSIFRSEKSAVKAAYNLALVLMTASEAVAWRAEDRSTPLRFTSSSLAIRLATWAVDACSWASCVRAALIRSPLRDSSILQSVTGTTSNYQMKDIKLRVVYWRGKQSSCLV
jgi:hypothetical protein